MIRAHVAVRRQEDGRILALRDGSLPVVELGTTSRWQDVGPIVLGMHERHGLDVVIVRPAWLADGAEGTVGHALDRLYEAELSGGALPSGSGWRPAADVQASDSAAASAAIANGALEPAEGDRQPWYRPGWWGESTAWVDERLGAAGIRRRGPLRQVRVWGRAAVATFETDRGRSWLKAVPAVFAHEVAVTELLADVDPGVAPPVVAADIALGRLVTEHVDGPLLADVADAQAWTATMARVAELQRALAGEHGSLDVAGVANASLDGLAAMVPRLLADDLLLRVGEPDGLSRAEAERLRGRASELVDACLGLAAGPVPDSLDHGDLNAGQVLVGDMGPVILDWSDGSITHPFLSAASFLRSAGGSRGAPVASASLEDAYLGPWLASGVGTEAELRATLARARVVHPIHVAALYAERVLPGLEQPWEMERVVPEALRSLA